MEMNKTTLEACEERLVFLVRNSLLVAQQEMGDGDQWPVVKDTIYKIMLDWENLKIERRVDEELQTHLYAQIKEMELGLEECTPEARKILEPKVHQWKEICDAYFSKINLDAVAFDEMEKPLHIKRMNMILSTMEDENA